MKLAGLRVLDLSLFLPGPMMTLMMADHGADVVKVEPPGEGEPTRGIGDRSGDTSAWFRNTHRGKRSVQLDLKTEPGRTALLAWARAADVVVEAFRPGVAARLGVDYARLSALNPGLVYCSISAFGQTGARRDLPAHDVAVEAWAGVLALNEGQDGKPAMPHLPAADALASLTALSGVMMALYRRQQTGRGDYLDVAMLDATLAWTPNVIGRVFASGRANVPKQERSWGGAALYNLYETSDHAWIVLGGSEAKFAANLLEGLGRPDLLPLAISPPGPAQEPVRAFLRDAFAARSRADWEAWFEDRDVAFAPVRTLKEAVDDPELAARGMIGCNGNGLAHLGTPIHFLDEPAILRLDAPALDSSAGEGWLA